MEDTIKKKIIIISLSQGVKSKNNPDFTFDICECMTRKEGTDKDGNVFVTYPTKTSFGTLEIGKDINPKNLTFGTVCVGEFGEVYDSDKKVNVLGLVGISKILSPAPYALETAFQK